MLHADFMALPNALKIASILWWSFSPQIILTLTAHSQDRQKASKNSRTSSVGIPPTFSLVKLALNTQQLLPLRSIATQARDSSIGNSKKPYLLTPFFIS